MLMLLRQASSKTVLRLRGSLGHYFARAAEVCDPRPREDFLQSHSFAREVVR